MSIVQENAGSSCELLWSTQFLFVTYLPGIWDPYFYSKSQSIEHVSSRLICKTRVTEKPFSFILADFSLLLCGRGASSDPEQSLMK